MTKKLRFNEIDSNNICRMGGNGPKHKSQFEGLSLVRDGESLLDIGFGSATTLECIKENFVDKNIKYKGVDFIDHRIPSAKKRFPDDEFEQQEAMDLDEKDNSWDVVWSRHVVDHLPGFEEALDEQLRVARKRVICILFVPPSDRDEHQIENIVKDGVVYENEYYNCYSKKKIKEYLDSLSGWEYSIRWGKGGTQKTRIDTIIHICRKSLTDVEREMLSKRLEKLGYK